MAETVDCARCGADNPADARFCIECGAPLTPATIGPTRRLGEMICPNCGSKNPENARFCGVCGQSLGGEAAPGRPTPAQQPFVQKNARQPQGDVSMYCPVCQEVALVMADRQGIEVDYCPRCRGVWLDRGELDKIIERVALAQGATARPASQHYNHSSTEHREHRDYDDDYRRKKKRGGLLDELFDFD